MRANLLQGLERGRMRRQVQRNKQDLEPGMSSFAQGPGLPPG